MEDIRLTTFWYKRSASAVPNKLKSVQEQTAAESKSIGFDYQYYYFLFQVLQLQTGQVVGYEVKDDVHIDTPNGEQTLIQLKHSIETKADGSIINLTEKDEDLWKTLSNWVKVINDEAEQRNKREAQIAFINKTRFFLVTNKSETESNKFLKMIDTFHKSNCTASDIKAYINTLNKPAAGKKPSVVDSYISLLEQQPIKWLEAFFKRLNVVYSQDELLEKIRLKIKEKNVSDSRLDDVFAAVDSRLRAMIYEDVKARKKFELTFEDYHKNFTRYFELGRSRKLPIKLGNKKIATPQDALNHTSIRQIIETEILSETDSDFEDKLVRIFTNKYEMNNHLERWIQRSEITEEERQRFDQESIDLWENVFDRTYAALKKKLRKTTISMIDPDDLFDLAAECYFDTLKIELSIDETQLDRKSVV